MNTEEIIQAVGPSQAQADQLEMIFLGLLALARRQANSLFQAKGCLLQVSLQLPGSSQVGCYIEVIRLGALRGRSSAIALAVSPRRT